jgi:serine/threonine protein kinase
VLADLIKDAGADELELSTGPGDVWIHVEPRSAEVPPEGWKLHISAIPSTAPDVLRRAFPLLLAEGVAFKLAAHERNLYELNQGAGGRSQVGKFITVYPRNDDQAVRLAVALDAATAGLRGPRVPSDRPLSPTSLVHYRYGDFLTDGDPGNARPASKPSPQDPFELKGVILPSEQKLIASRYLITSTLHRSIRGAIHLAVEVTQAKTCVLKRAWRDACAMPDGTDARDRLREEADLMRRLSGDPHFPEVWDVVEHEQDLFLVMEYVSGPTLAARVHEDTSGGHPLPVEETKAIARELADALEKMHGLGIVHRDLSPANVIIRADGGVSLVDFELALPIGSRNEGFGAGTSGYMSPEQAEAAPASVADDIYALGALLYLAATGTDPDPEFHPDPPQADLTRVPQELALVITGCLERDPGARWESMSSLRNALDR